MKNKIISKATSLLLAAAFLCSSGNTAFAAVKSQREGLNTAEAISSEQNASAIEKLIASIDNDTVKTSDVLSSVEKRYNASAERTALVAPSADDYISDNKKTAFNLKISDPTAADLNYSQDFGDPEAIKAIADKLGDAVDIYNFVRNGIQNEMYKGYKKGPALTLAQMGGNDMDQAALLVALLRAKNIPARFIRSNVKLSVQQSLDLSGAADLETAESIFAASYPGAVRLSTIKTTGEQVDSGFALIGHTWVEAYIPYTDYRGAGRKSGEGVWIQLDPSFKKVIPVKTEFEPEFNAEQKKMLESLQASSDITPDLSADDFKAPEKAEYTTLRIEQRNEPYLPSSLPYEFYDSKNHTWIAEQFSVIKSSDKHTVTLKINGSTVGTAFPVAEIGGNYIGIDYEPANEKSKTALEGTDDITKLDPSKINLTPVITIGDKEYKSTAKCTLGQTQKLEIIIANDTVPGKTVAKAETLDKTLVGGSVYAINLDLGTISPVESEIADHAYQDAIDNHETKQAISSDVFGKIAGYAGKEYFTFCDYTNQIHKGIDNVRSDRHLAVAVTGYELVPEYSSSSVIPGINIGNYPDPDFEYEDSYTSSMTASSVDYGNFKIDVLYDEVTTVNLDGDKDIARYYNFATGYEASKLEGEIWADITKTDQPCISTVSVMNAAAEKGIDPVYINKYNLSDLKKYKLDENTVNDINAFVNSGRFIILIPEMIKINDWEGTAYIALDLSSGAAHFMISGGLAGGESPKMPEDEWDKLWTLNCNLSRITQAVGLFSMSTSCLDLSVAAQERDYKDIVKGIHEFGAAAIIYNSGIQMQFDMLDWIDEYLANPGSDQTKESLAKKTEQNIRTTTFALLSLYSQVPVVGKAIQVLTSINTEYDLITSVLEGDDSAAYNLFVSIWDLMGYLV